MGTLTGDMPRLPQYCDHKLPTSCRLSSIPECCACADERAHSAAYSTYIDGIGFVQRGLRWQRYCWFCKTFWQNRVDASGLHPAATRIPTVPDQSDFLQRWYEFHQKYKILQKDDGTQERISVVGEDFKDVSPGHLPRTREEMEAGQSRSRLDEIASTIFQPVASEGNDGPSLEDTLEQMLQEARTEEGFHAVAATQNETRDVVREAEIRTNLHAQAMVPTGRSRRPREYHTRRIAALRRELYRMRSGIERVISGLRDLGENVPDATEATERLETLGRTLDDISGGTREQAQLAIQSINELTRATNEPNTDRASASLQIRITEARESLNEARRMQDQVSAELRAAEEERRAAQSRLQRLEREQRTTENYIRVFGTREDIAAQGESYESPIGGMFNRAYERFRAAENVRQEERMLRRVMAEEDALGGEEAAQRLAQIQDMDRDIWGVPTAPRSPLAQADHDLAAEMRASSIENTRSERLAQRRDARDQLLQSLARSNTSQLMEMARDETFGGQSESTAGDEQENAPPGQEDAADAPIQAYYDSLRRQGWSQGSPLTSPSQRTNMLLQYPELAELNPVETISRIASIRQREITTLYELNPLNWRLDMHMLLQAMHSGRVAYPDITNYHSDLSMAISKLNLDNHSTTDEELKELHESLDALFSDDDLVWRASLPSQWFLRHRISGAPLTISGNPTSDGREEQRQNIEGMLSAFQGSSTVRQHSNLPIQQQQEMLTRLSQGQRSTDDRRIAWTMLSQTDTVELAKHQLQASDRSADTQVAALEAQRRQAARAGDVSRTNLNQRRFDARTSDMMAVLRHDRERLAAMLARYNNRRNQSSDEDAAEATAMQRMDESISRSRRRRQAEIQALQAGHDLIETDVDTEPDDDEVGLDAPDTGRPEPKSEEEMTMKLECHVCYSQLADIACLPCGHLVMCKWCSDQHSPVMKHDQTRPRSPANCPICRKRIKQKVRVFRA